MSIINEALKKVGEDKRWQHVPHKGKAPVGPNKKFIWAVILLTLIGNMLIGGIFLSKRLLKPLTQDVAQKANRPSVLEGYVDKLSGVDYNPKTEQDIITLRASVPLPPKLTLNGIVYDAKKPYAIVNNKILLKGESIEGAILVEINEDNVKFVFKGREFEVRPN